MLSFSDRSIPAGKPELMIARKQERYIKDIKTRGWNAWNKTGKQWRGMTKEAIWMRDVEDLTPIEQLQYYLKATYNKWQTQYMVCWGNQLYDISRAEFIFRLDGLEFVTPDTDVISMYFSDGEKINLYPEGWGF